MKRTLAAGIVLAALSSATALASADAATSGPATQHAKAGTYRVTATVNKTEPLLNKKVKIKGTVSPAAPGAAVTLQVKYEGRKRVEDHRPRPAQRRQQVKFKDKVGSVRERRYRVVKAAGANRGAGRSPSLKVTVFGWRDLDLAEARCANNGFYETGTATINGMVYPNSLRRARSASRRTYRLQPQPGLQAARRGLRHRRLVPDWRGRPAWRCSPTACTKHSGTFGLTQSQRVVTVDLTGVFRLTISSTVAGGAVAAVGTPQVLCSF